MNKILARVWWCIFWYLLLYPRLALGGTTTTTFTVTASLGTSCTVTANNLAFGNYNPISSTSLTGQTNLTVTCTSGAAYNVGINAGTSSGATVTTRKMTGQSSSTHTLSYSLYRDSGRSQNWGITVGTDTFSGTGTGSAQNIIVYGLVPATQSSAADTYLDTVTVSITY